MPIPFTAVTMAMQVGGGLLGKSAADDAAEKMEELADDKARLSEQTTQENLRRMTFDRGMELGGAKAASYASNTLNTGSSAQFQRVMAEQWNAEMGWERRKGRLEASIIRKEGSLQADQTRDEGMRDLIGGVTDAAGTFIGAGGIKGMLSKTSGGDWILGKKKGPG